MHWHKKQGLQEERVVQMVNDQKNQLWILYGSNAGNRSSNGKCDVMDLNTLEIKPFSKIFKNAPFPEMDIAWLVANEKKEVMIITNHFKVYHYSATNGFQLRGNYKMDYDNLITNHVFCGDDC